MRTSLSPRDVLIVGGGLSATALVGALRNGGFAGRIVVASASAMLPYDHPPLTKELFTRTSPDWLLEQFDISPAAAEWMLNRRATRIEQLEGGGAQVWLAAPDGVGEEHVEAPVVVLAPGTGPRHPWDGPHSLTNWSEAVAVRAQLTPGSSLAIIGAGWLGSELAAAASGAGYPVALFGADPLPLAGILPLPVAERLWQPTVDITYSAEPVLAASADTVVTAAGRYSAEVVVAAVGTTPHTGWLPTQLHQETGHIPTDWPGQTAWPGVWAMGDAAAPGGQVSQHWNAAVHSARRTAAALLGQEVPGPEAPSVFSKLFGHEIDVLGWPRPEHSVTWRESESGWTALLHEGTQLAAGVVVGAGRDAGGLRKLLRGGPVQVDPGALAKAERLTLPQ